MARTIVIDCLLPVVDVVLSAILLVDWPLVVAVNHPVDSQDVCLVFLHHALRLQHQSGAPW